MSEQTEEKKTELAVREPEVLAKKDDLKQYRIEEPKKDFVVIARNPQEMETAQKKLISWAERKMAEKKEEAQELQTNYEIAKKNKWRSEAIKRAAQKAQKKYEFYEKVKAALDAGYCIVPNFDIDVFAIRTTKTEPKTNDVYGTWTQPKPQQPTLSALGKGEYKSPLGTVYQDNEVIEHEAGKEPKRQIHRWVDAFEEVDFPFHFAKPEILNDASRAMALKVFDEMGILPRRAVRGDPMVIGRITYKENTYSRKDISFIVTWFVDTRDI